ncbi:HalOD1 output domain-containing protein [Salinigranum sp. GCM10025319]|uniref:HalOD1 output domain-containing protein n=1 Tax=Salinigranum sp. GCM10025319 TaxID=3252687 RepID=UPI003609396C
MCYFPESLVPKPGTERHGAPSPRRTTHRHLTGVHPSSPIMNQQRNQATGWEGSVSYTVLDTISRATGRHKLDLSQLATVLDTEALDRLLGDADKRSASGLTVRFRYEGYRVSIESDGTVELEPLSET